MKIVELKPAVDDKNVASVVLLECADLSAVDGKIIVISMAISTLGANFAGGITRADTEVLEGAIEVDH